VVKEKRGCPSHGDGAGVSGLLVDEFSGHHATPSSRAGLEDNLDRVAEGQGPLPSSSSRISTGLCPQVSGCSQNRHAKDEKRPHRPEMPGVRRRAS